MNSELSTLFSYLNVKGIKYFLLTDFESDFTSNDIDLFINPNQKHFFEKSLFKLGWFRRREPAFHVNHNFYYSPKSEVYLDVKYEPTFANGPNKCCTYVNSNNNAVEVTLNGQGVFRPYGLEAIILYAAHLAYKERGKLEEKHRAYLAQYIDLYSPEVDEDMLNVVEQIKQWLLLSFPEGTSRLQQIIQPYFRTDRHRMTRSGSFKFGYGLNVLFLGTDGSGKTTLVEAVGNKLNIKNNRLYLGSGENSWSSHTMKRMYDFKFKVKPFNKLYNLIKTFALLPLEFSIRIAPVLRKSRYNVTLIDRFPGFVFLDKKQGRSLLYKSILPNPDLVFFLYADPEILVQRKPDETSLERSKNDIVKFERVADIVSKGNYKSIDTSKVSIDEARDFVISEIFRHPKLYKTLLTTEPCN